ncbi:hypothetical protein BN1322_410016 [Staphylococcus aureus]|nr:hypothetical protein BN1322_410016 [Staphylococcus aureus]
MIMNDISWYHPASVLGDNILAVRQKSYFYKIYFVVPPQ